MSRPFPKTIQRLQRAGFASVGYCDPTKRSRRLMSNAKRVRAGKRNPWAAVAADGAVEYFQVDPRPWGYGRGNLRAKEATP